MHVDDNDEWHRLIDATRGDAGGANPIDPAASDACCVVGASVGDNPRGEIKIVSIVHPSRWSIRFAHIEEKS